MNATKYLLSRNLVLLRSLAFLTAVLSCQATQASLSTNLIGHWKLDEASGTVATDSSGSGINGTYTNGAAPGSVGIVGRAADFDGTDDHVVINGSSTYNTRDNFTIACWAKSDTATFNGHGCLVSKRHAWVLHPSNGGTALYFHVANSAGNQYSGTFDMLEVGGIQQWHHYVGVYDGTSGVIKLYIDGVLRESSTFTAGSRVNSNNSSMTIGKDSTYSSADRHFDGKIDEVRLYERALSDDEIAALYTGLVGHWKLDETSGTTALDSSEYGHDGTFTNGATPGSEGIRGYASDFDGTNDHVAINGGSNYNLQQSLTVACWAKSDTPVYSGWGCLVSKRNQFYLHPSYNGTSLYFEVNHSGGVGFSGNFDLAELGGIDQWRHYVGVYDFSAGEVRLYVDGVLRSTGTISAGTQLLSDTGAMTIGRDEAYTSGTRFFDGKIDDVRLYNRSLSDEEVMKLYGLIGHWKLNESSGTVAADSGPHGFDAVYENGVVVGADGIRGKAADFDGTDDGVRIADDSTFDLTEAVSLAAWVKFDTVSASASQRIINRGNATGYQLMLDTNGKISFECDGISGTADLVSNRTLTAGKWTQVVGVYSGASIKLYLDGELDNQASANGPVTNATSDIMLGNRSAGDYPLNGILDDARIYDRAMTEKEIAEHYGLIAHWKLNETTGTDVFDSSAYGSDGVYDGTLASVEGIRNNAFDLAAENHVNSEDQVFNPGDEDFSFGVWFKSESNAGGSYPTIVSKYSATEGYILYLDSGTLYFTLRQGGSYAFASCDELQDGRWHQVFCVKTADELKMYVDGELRSTKAHALTGSIDNVFYHTVGGWNASRSFVGQVDEHVFYLRKVTDLEIAEHYGLVGHWKLDETSGSIATDSSGVNNQGHYWNGATPGGDGPYPGDGETAAVLGGSDAHVGAYPTETYDNITETMSVAAWVRFDIDLSNQTEQEKIIYRENYSGNAGFALLADQPYGDRIIFRVHDGSSHGSATWTNPGITAGQWHHYVGTYDGSVVRLYVDGQLKASTNYVTSSIVQHTPNNLAIGTDVKGRMFDARLYNRAINHWEVAKLYGLVGHWNFEESSGTVVADSSGMQQDGAIAGSPVMGTSSRGSSLGTAIDLNGSSDYITTGQSLANNLASFTMAGWVRPDDVDAYTSLFGQHSVLEFGIYDTPNRIRLWTGNGFAFDYDGALAPGRWTHLAVTGDGTQIKLYVDGIEATSVNQSATDYGSSTEEFSIGEGAWAGSGDYFNGRMDDVRLYNRAISREEARGLYYGKQVKGVRIIRWEESR